MVDVIEQRLVAESDAVVRMTSREALDAWSAWREHYPIERKPPHSILESTVVGQLAALPRSLHDKHAIAAYRASGPVDVYVLLVDSLVAWRCTFVILPELAGTATDVLVAACDFSWTFGSRKHSGPVFIDRGDL